MPTQTLVSCRCGSTTFRQSSIRFTKRSTGFLTGRVDVYFHGACRRCGRNVNQRTYTNVPRSYQPGRDVTPL
jgi:predicted nucleic-acid-binding Zn-ribbon protein